MNGECYFMDFSFFSNVNGSPDGAKYFVYEFLQTGSPDGALRNIF